MKFLTLVLSALITFSLATNLYAESKAAIKPEGNMVVIAKKPKLVSVPETFGSSRLWDWHVLDNRHLVVQLNDGTKYLATLMAPCTGLPFTDVLGFSTQGPFQIDSWTNIHLPGGETCYVKTLTKYHEAEK
ncbi:MAG: DUF6491 family protein [Gammaproteobacteria bacterium]